MQILIFTDCSSIQCFNSLPFLEYSQYLVPFISPNHILGVAGILMIYVFPPSYLNWNQFNEQFLIDIYLCKNHESFTCDEQISKLAVESSKNYYLFQWGAKLCVHQNIFKKCSLKIPPKTNFQNWSLKMLLPQNANFKNFS